MRLGRVDVGQRSETIHRANLSAIVRGLHALGPLSRSQLVASTGLTRSAIRALTGELVAAGLVAEEPAIRLGTPGRPSPMVHLNPTAAAVLGLEILVDSISAGIFGLGGRPLARIQHEMTRGDLAVDDVVAAVVALTGELRKRTRAPLIGIGVAVAGVVRRDDGMIRMAPNIGWTDVPLGAKLARALEVAMPISVANDADLGALAEHRRGTAVGVDDVLYISGEVGVGCGVIIGGQALTGAAGYAGEVGHLPLNPSGAVCRCGSTGCWETEIGAGRLLELAGYPRDGGPSALDALVADAEAGRPTAVAALEHVARWLGIGLGALVNAFNPRLIVLGGIHGRIHPFVRDTIEAHLARNSLSAPRELVRIVPASLGADAPLVGAAELAFEPLLADPAAWFTPRANVMRLATA